VGGKAGMDGRYEEKKILLSSHEWNSNSPVVLPVVEY
jgi:hypothetical protein